MAHGVWATCPAHRLCHCIAAHQRSPALSGDKSYRQINEEEMKEGWRRDGGAMKEGCMQRSNEGGKQCWAKE